MIVPRSTIYKQKRKVFAFVSISLCLPPSLLTFPKIMPKYLKSSSKKSSGDMRRSNSSWSNWKKQQSHIRLSMWLRRQGRKLRGEELYKRRRRRGEHWSTSNNSRTRCLRKMLLFWRALKGPRLQNLSTRRHH